MQGRRTRRWRTRKGVVDKSRPRVAALLRIKARGLRPVTSAVSFFLSFSPSVCIMQCNALPLFRAALNNGRERLSQNKFSSAARSAENYHKHPLPSTRNENDNRRSLLLKFEYFDTAT